MVQKGADGPLWTTLERLQACHVWPFWIIFGPWMASYGSETSFPLGVILSATDDLVKVSWESDARECQNQLTAPYFDQLSERSQPLSRKSLLARRKVDGGVLDAIFDDWRPNGASFNQQPEDYFGRLASNRRGAALPCALSWWRSVLNSASLKNLHYFHSFSFLQI